MITVFGSIGMDLLFSLPHLPAVGETVLTPAYTTAMGGKGANQAVAAARDGGRVRFVGSAGADDFGNEARSLLRAEGIDLAGFATVDAATCVASICFDAQGRNQIAVASGANLSTRADALRRELLASGDWLVLQMEIPSGEVSKAVSLAKARSARVILNLAPALPVEEAALRQVDVLIHDFVMHVMAECCASTCQRLRESRQSLQHDFGSTALHRNIDGLSRQVANPLCFKVADQSQLCAYLPAIPRSLHLLTLPRSQCRVRTGKAGQRVRGFLFSHACPVACPSRAGQPSCALPIQISEINGLGSLALLLRHFLGRYIGNRGSR